MKNKPTRKIVYGTKLLHHKKKLFQANKKLT